MQHVKANIMARVKVTFKSNPILYWLWFSFSKKRFDSNVRLPRKSDDFYFDGFPRSGNTYLSGLLNHIYPELKFASHLHCIAGIKMALLLNLPIVVVFRNPKDSVSSLILSKYKDKELNVKTEIVVEKLLYYLEYTKFINSNSNNLFMIHLDQFLEDEQIYFNKISGYIGKKPPVNFTDLKIDFMQKIQKLENNKLLKSNSKSGTLPNKQREILKKEIQAMFIKLDLYEECVIQYNHILSKVSTQ